MTRRKTKPAFTYLRNGFVRYDARRQHVFGDMELRRWKGLGDWLGKHIHRFVPQSYAYSLFLEAGKAGYVPINNGRWCGRLTDQRICWGIATYLKSRGKRYVRDFFKDAPEQDPAELVIKDRDLPLYTRAWREGYEVGLSEKRTEAA